MINVGFSSLFCFDRKQEQEGASEEEVQDLKEGEAAPPEEGQGGKEARRQSQEEEAREGPWNPQRLALQGTGAQGPRSPPCPCYRGVGAKESRPQRKGIHSCLPSYCLLFSLLWDWVCLFLS